MQFAIDIIIALAVTAGICFGVAGIMFAEATVSKRKGVHFPGMWTVPIWISVVGVIMIGIAKFTLVR